MVAHCRARSRSQPRPKFKPRADDAIRQSIEAERPFSRTRIAPSFLREFSGARVANAGDLIGRRASECFLLDCSSMGGTVCESTGENRGSKHQSAASRMHFVRLVLDLVCEKNSISERAHRIRRLHSGKATGDKSRRASVKSPGVFPDQRCTQRLCNFFCSIDVETRVQHFRAQLSGFVARAQYATRRLNSYPR